LPFCSIEIKIFKSKNYVEQGADVVLCPVETHVQSKRCAFTSLCIYVCMYVCMYVRMYVCMYVCVCIYIYIYMANRVRIRQFRDLNPEASTQSA